MSGNTTIVSSTPGFVVGTYGAKQVRNAALAMYAGRPGLVSRGDFAVTQRGAGANMSVDIAAGAAIVYPASVTRQGPYYVQSDATYNTSSDGGYSWTAADATNPRIDLVCLEVKDNAEDASGSTGLRFRVVDGTPNASATHQLATTYWPAVPTGCVPIAAIKIPATDTSISTTDITNLNPIAGPNQAYSLNSTAETTTSSSYARLSSPDFVCVYVPHAYARVRVFSEGQWKISVASGTQGITLYLNDAQIKGRNATNGAPAVTEATATLGTFLSRFTTATASGAPYYVVAGATSDVSNITTGVVSGAAAGVGVAVEISQLAAGWYVIEQRYKTSANTLTVDERSMWAEVIG
jgi:hypothetical protein